MPPPRLLSSSDSEASSDHSSSGVTFDPDLYSQSSSIVYRNPSSQPVEPSASRQTHDFTPFHGERAPSESSTQSRPGRPGFAPSDYSNFQQSAESGSDSFQEESYYAKNLPYRFASGTVGAGKSEKHEKKSLQREFEDLLRKYRKKHIMKIHRTFIRLWRTGALCDIILKTNDTQIPVHSAVVVSHSGLCEKESRDFHSNNTLPIVITLSNKLITKAVLLVVDFLYLAKIEIELATLVAVHDVAKELEVYALTARCNKLLDRLLEDQSIVQTIQAATEYGIDDLQQIAWSKFTKEFKVFCSRSSFQEQTLQTVIKVLTADHLAVKSEFEVFEAAMTWINHKRNERLRYLPRLMDCVRLIYMTDEELVDCMQYDEVFASSPGLEILAQANMNKMLKDRSELPSDYPMPRNRTANTRNRHLDDQDREAKPAQQTQSAPALSPFRPSAISKQVDWRHSAPQIGPPIGSPFTRNDFRSAMNPRKVGNRPLFSSPSFLLPEF